MALTRSMLKGMGLTDEQVGAIIEEHVAVTTALKDQINEHKEEIDSLKEANKNLSNVQKDFDDYKNSVAENDWENKYNKEHEQFEAYKNDVASKENAAKIRDAYKKLLTECKVGEKHLESILKVTDLKSMKLDEKGSLENAEELKKAIITDWDGFISTKETRGAEVENPPGNGSNDHQVGRAAEIAAKYHENLYGKKEG